MIEPVTAEDMRALGGLKMDSPMDRHQEIETLLSIYLDVVTPDAVAFYVRLLESFSDDDVRRAVENWAATRSEAPKPSDLVERCRLKKKTLQDLITAFSHKTGISVSALRSSTRTKEIAHARQDFMREAHNIRLSNGRRAYSLTVIGRFLGNRDHTTILYGIRASEKREEEK